METPPVSTAVTEDQIDWVDVRARFRRHLRSRFQSWDEGRVEELVSEAVYRLLLAVRARPAERIHGLIAVIAATTEANAIRRWKRKWAKEVALTEEGPEPTVSDPPVTYESDDPIVRIRWVVLEHFRRHDVPCQHLAAEFFADHDWKRVATTLGRSHSAIRKQWSRCVEALRGAIGTDPGPLWDWIHEHA